MADYQIAFNLTTYVATVQALGDALPSGSVNIGVFDHGVTADDGHGDAVNHVLFHHVREALYKRSAANAANTAMFPFNITDMAKVTINQDLTYTAVTAISSTPATVTLAANATQQITNTFTPTSPSNTGVTYASSNTAKATVSATGLITAVATGSATITITTADGGFTDTCVVTIS